MIWYKNPVLSAVVFWNRGNGVWAEEDGCWTQILTEEQRLKYEKRNETKTQDFRAFLQDKRNDKKRI